jgi:hypothetical protein
LHLIVPGIVDPFAADLGHERNSALVSLYPRHLPQCLIPAWNPSFPMAADGGIELPD